MKLTNKTKWDTASLRAIVAACLVARGVPSRGLSVEIVASRKPRVTGWAWIGRWFPAAGGRKVWRPGGGMLLRLPNPDGQRDWLVPFAQVTEHEIAHLAGLDYSHMSERLYSCKQDVAPWLGALKLEPAIEPDRDAVRAAERSGKEAHARAMLVRAERRLKLATTIAKRWRRRVGYYDRGST